MASLMPGYEYDVFISYRHKDDKYDHWVTDFVINLTKELETTFREEISVYFDSNPADGLQSTHDVDDSLKHKLKCLVFIPVISHTYCDPDSFAWNNEFRSFVQLASNDDYGMKLRLPNGNYASRVLPVLIHDLPDEEKLLCEKILGSKLRGIDFIYREPGVNRPLLPNEDKNYNNLNHTIYRNQINKVANSVKDIITAIRKFSSSQPEVAKANSPYQKHSGKKLSSPALKIMAAAIILFIMAASGVLFMSGIAKKNEDLEKSIAVLPFKNLSNDPDNDYFGEGMSQEILDNLFMIDSLKIPTARSSFEYKDSQLSNTEIARKLRVSYLLEGDIKLTDNRVRIIARLIDAREDKTVWSEKYDRFQGISDYIDIQSEVAQKVAEKLRIVLKMSVIDRMSVKPTKNPEAYNLYLKAVSERYKVEAMKMLEEAIGLDSLFAPAYTELSFYYIFSGGHLGIRSREEVLENAEPLVKTALRLDENLLSAHTANAYLRLYYYQDFKKVNEEYELVKKLSPSNMEAISWFSDYLIATGRIGEALEIVENSFPHNQSVSSSWENLALAYYFDHQEEKSVEIILQATRMFPDEYHILLNVIRLLNYTGKYNEVINIYNNMYNKDDPNHNISWIKGHIGVAACKTGDKNLANSCLQELMKRSEQSPIGSPSYFAASIFTAMNEKDNALKMLEKAYETREVELYWLKVEPLFNSLHGDPRFESLLKRIGFS